MSLAAFRFGIHSTAVRCCWLLALLFSLRASAAGQSSIIVRPYLESPRKDVRDVIPYRPLKRPRVALVLSGGGSRGVAEIGVLEVLEKNHVPIDMIVGTSLGSIIGGLYASGYSTRQLEDLADTTRWNEVLALTDETDRSRLYVGQKQAADKSLLTIRFDGLTPVIPSSLSSGQRLTSFINELTLQGIYHPHPTFDNLKVPFRSVATDLLSGKRIVIGSGDLAEAMRASIAIPLLYSAVKKDSLELVDGGLVSNIPVDVANDLGYDFVIAVDAASPLRSSAQMRAPWETADQIIGIMAQLANKQALEKATIVIKPQLHHHMATDFTGLDTLIEEGRLAAERALPAILDTLHRRQTETYLTGPDASLLVFRPQELRVYSDSTLVPTPDTLTAAVIRPSLTIGDLRAVVSTIYATGDYRDAYAEVAINDSGGVVTIHLVPNPIVRSVSIAGNAMIPTGELEAEFTPIVGKRLNARRSRGAIEDLLSLYRDNGYSLARIVTTAFNDTTGDLHILLDEGVIVHESIEGTKKSRDWVIWRELAFDVGDVFTVAKAKQSIANLIATNLFDQVLIEVRYAGDVPDVIVKAAERSSEALRLGLRVDNDRNMQPSVEVRDDNFLGTATEIGGSFAGGLRNRSYLFDFRANRIFNTYFTFDLNTYYDLRDENTYADDPSVHSATSFNRIRIGQYRQILYGASLSLGRQVERLGNVTAQYRIEQDEIRFLDGTGYSTGELALRTLRLLSTVDTQDKFPFPDNGSLMHISWETASSFVGAQIGYSKLFFSYEWYSTWIGDNTIHPKFTFGFADATLPLSQQFSLGGEDSFFGLLENDSRGRQIFLINIEDRILLPLRFVWNTYFRLRYDFGSIWAEQSAITLRDLHHGVGVGLAIDTPIGPASFSVGRSFYVRRDLLNRPLTLGPIVSYFSLGLPLR